MQSSNEFGNSPYTTAVLPTKRPWKLGAALFGLLSVAGGLLVNNYLNPESASSGITAIGVGAGSSVKPDKTVTSDAVPYQYGTVQLSVTRTAGKISAIDIGQSGATAGREQAFPYLVQYAIKAQGTSFANLSGATSTTDAFPTALYSSL
ncbi:MAG: hypothetical protein ACKOUD_05595, partial [Rhodoluna sp.]